VSDRWLPRPKLNICIRNRGPAQQTIWATRSFPSHQYHKKYNKNPSKYWRDWLPYYRRVTALTAPCVLPPTAYFRHPPPSAASITSSTSPIHASANQEVESA